MGYKESKSLNVREKDIVNLNAFWRERQQYCNSSSWLFIDVLLKEQCHFLLKMPLSNGTKIHINHIL
jgi:hypothetical protein